MAHTIWKVKALLIFMVVLINHVSSETHDDITPLSSDYVSSRHMKKLVKKNVKRSMEYMPQSNGQSTFRENKKLVDTMQSPVLTYTSDYRMTDEDKQQLGNIFGPKVVNEHEQDFETVGNIGIQEGANEHNIPWNGAEAVTGLDSKIRDEALLNAINEDAQYRNTQSTESVQENQKDSLDPNIVKQMLQDLLQRLDNLENRDVMKEDIQPVVTITNGHCNIHGLWLSTVAGAAIELIPVEQDGHIEIATKIYDLPENPEKGLITSHWTGKGMISSESPTTLNIVFQEHLTDENRSNNNYEPDGNEKDFAVKLPKTAVFVGQCLVCENSPVLQGTWVVFPNAQSCILSKINSKEEKPLPSPDTFYRLN